MGAAAAPDSSYRRRASAVALAVLLLGVASAATSGCGTHRGAIEPPPVAIVPRKPAPPARPRRVRLPPMGTAQFRVCAFGFHSPAELAEIAPHFPERDFQFLDLTPAADEREQSIAPMSSPPAKPASSWFTDLCRPGLRCDVVIYSGEFAGGFFGSYGVSLKLQEMEEASCQSRCRGLFHDPREVFLLACNTLATKSPDQRTPEEYFQVLRAHGFEPAEAERVVDLRYGPFGPSFRESLRRIFMGVPRIYGFASVAPFGEATVPRLHEYFQRKSDYARYLSRAGRDTAPNKELLAAFAGTNLVQTSGIAPLETIAADRALVCRLYDESDSVADRLRIVHRLLARSDFLSFVPTVEVFLSRHPPPELRADEREILREIESLEIPRRQLVDLMRRLNVSVLKMQMANLAVQLAWIPREEFRAVALEGAKQLLVEPLSSEGVDVMCKLSKWAPAGAALRSEEIPQELLLHPEGFRLLDCLSPADPRLSVRMLVGLESLDDVTRVWAAYALSRRLPLEDAVLTAVARHLNDPSAGVRERVRWILAIQVPLSPGALAAIRERDPALAKSLEARARERAR